ncbi:MAG: M14 family zinc carboxypeptidase [Fusobacteriaceae bacterium]
MTTTIFGFLGKDYKEPEALKKHFPKEIPIVSTPSVIGKKSNFTTQKEIRDYLEEININSVSTVVNQYGPTAGSLYIFAIALSKDKSMTFTTTRNDKPTVMLIGGQHADEPMSADVLIASIKRIAVGDLNYLLERINVVVLPRINPDGVKNFTRVSGEGKDINADHLDLNTIEASSLRVAYDLFKPEVFVDIHEYIADVKSYDGVLKTSSVPLYDILTLEPTNPNYPEDLKAYSRGIIDKMMEDLKSKGYTSNLYYNPFKKPSNKNPLTLYRVTSDLNLARNMYGLKGSLSILIELRGRGIGFENVERRLNSGLVAVESILRSTYDAGDSIKMLAKDRGLEVENLVIKNSAVIKENIELQLLDFNTGALIKTPALLIQTKTLNLSL